MSTASSKNWVFHDNRKVPLVDWKKKKKGEKRFFFFFFLERGHQREPIKELRECRGGRSKCHPPLQAEAKVCIQGHDAYAQLIFFFSVVRLT